MAPMPIVIVEKKLLQVNIVIDTNDLKDKRYYMYIHILVLTNCIYIKLE